METKLARISQLSKENPDMVFTSLGHLINKEMLENCHVQMDGTKAIGIDAVWFYEHLKHRMGHFGLSLEKEKSRLIEFGRYAKERCSKSGTKPGTFTFLGFTHYCSKSKNGRFRVKRKTSKKKFAKKCREINQLMGHMKTWKLKEITAKLNQILTGYYHYYGITDNTERITAFRYHVMKSLFYCLNRRSQKKSYNWVEFLNMIDNSYPLVRPRIYVSVYN